MGKAFPLHDRWWYRDRWAEYPCPDAIPFGRDQKINEDRITEPDT